MDEMQMDITDVESEAASQTTVNSISESSPVQIETDSTFDQVAIDFPTEPCGHCWMHSQPASGTATLVAVVPTKKLIDTNAPPAEVAVTSPSPFIGAITPVEHGPPGDVLPRHLLINVFRI